MDDMEECFNVGKDDIALVFKPDGRVLMSPNLKYEDDEINEDFVNNLNEVGVFKQLIMIIKNKPELMGAIQKVYSDMVNGVEEERKETKRIYVCYPESDTCH